MRETTKSNKRRSKDPIWKDIFKGDVLDIGCGDDPLKEGEFDIKSVRTFDMQDGDANNITRHVREQFDCVYGSQVLEHMWNPPGTLLQWWSLVKSGGWIVITIPDFELYEHLKWPSQYNGDHKWGFSLKPDAAWKHYNRVINPEGMLAMLPGKTESFIELVSTNYNFEDKTSDQTLKEAEAWIEFAARKI